MKFKAFTLAEGATHVDISSNIRRAAFTLAEVLITIAIIGIVAAMTIPTLVQNYQTRAWNTSAQVFERKLEEALRQMNTQQVLAGYKSTADFVNALGKYFKINKVCQNDDIMSCFEDKVYWGVDEEEIDMTKIKNAKNFGQDDWDTETIGVQFANGTTGLIAYNPDCKEQPFSNQFTGTSCLAILYDTTGFKTPNTQQKDLRSINVLSLGSGCAIELDDGTCFTAPFKANPITYEECAALKDKLGINYCTNVDLLFYWEGAVKACGGVNKMPTQAQLAKLAEKIYGVTVPISGKKSGLQRNNEIFAEMGFPIGYTTIGIWSGEAKATNTALFRQFSLNFTSGSSIGRNNDFSYTICIID